MQTAIDVLTAKHTGFPTFGTLIEASRTGYTPTFRLDLIGEREGLTFAYAFNRSCGRAALVWDGKVAVSRAAIERMAAELDQVAA